MAETEVHLRPTTGFDGFIVAYCPLCQRRMLHNICWVMEQVRSWRTLFQATWVITDVKFAQCLGCGRKFLYQPKRGGTCKPKPVLKRLF